MLPEAAERGLSTNAEDIVDVRTDPLFSEAGGFTFEQLPGEVVFVPTAWFHQVQNSVGFLSNYEVVF